MESERTSHLLQRLQQSQQKIAFLQKINSQLSSIIQSTQIAEYKQLLDRLQEQQNQASTMISQLKLQVSQLQAELKFSQSRFNMIVSQLTSKSQGYQTLVQKLKQSLNKTMRQNTHLKQQLHEHKLMIKNQQQLIDQYKCSLEQQKQIQRQISKCHLNQIQSKLKQKMQKQVENIKKQYEKQLSALNQKQVSVQYEKQIKNLEKYLTSKKKEHRLSNKKLTAQKENIHQSQIHKETKKQKLEKKGQNMIGDEVSDKEPKLQQASNNKIQSLGSTLEQSMLSKYLTMNSNKNRGKQNKIHQQHSQTKENTQKPLKKVKQQNIKSSKKQPASNLNSSKYLQRPTLNEITQSMNNITSPFSKKQTPQSKTLNQSHKKLLFNSMNCLSKNFMTKANDESSGYYIIDEFREDQFLDQAKDNIRK